MSSKSTKVSLDELLDMWNTAKVQEAKAKKECERFREKIVQYMDSKGVDELESESFSVTRRTTTKLTMAQKNVPPEIWSQYATRSTFDTVTLKKK